MKQTNVNPIFMEEDVQNSEEEIVAYSADWKPLNRQQYIDAINEARKEIAEGKFITHEECMKYFYSKYNG
jgi:predicted transcriptional regulator